MPPHTPAVAAFDLDGTLTEGGSVFRWLESVAGVWRVWRSALWRTLPLAWAALRSGTAADQVKEHLFRAILSGRLLEDVQRASRDFAVQHLAAKGRQHVIDRLRWHLERGDQVVVVSASPAIYVSVIAETLGAHGAVGTRLAVDPLGRLTGGYLGLNCRGEEKMRRLSLWMSDAGIAPDTEIYAYGNSRGDRRLLAGSTYGFDCGKLGKIGALRAYPRLRTHTSTPEVAQ